MAESEEELKGLLMKVKNWLKTQRSKNEDHGILSHPSMANGETAETVTDFTFLISPKSLWTVTAGMKLKDTCSLEEKL